MICPKCKKELKDGVKFCGYCGKKINSVNTLNTGIEETMKNAQIVADRNKAKFEESQRRFREEYMQFKREHEERERKSQQEKQQQQQLAEMMRTQAAPVETQSNVAKCPRCGSTSLQAKTKGVSVGKAAAGALLIGPLGLLAGGIGMNDARIVCLNCGHEFDPRGNY